MNYFSSVNQTNNDASGFESFEANLNFESSISRQLNCCAAGSPSQLEKPQR